MVIQFALTLLSVFLGSLLLFQIQPMIGKMILPWFGGGASVWTVCMLFFQCMLLAGYSYAYLLNKRFTLPRQVALHSLLLLLSLFFLPVVPIESLLSQTDTLPTWRILLVLLSSVGLPYFLLAANGPLVQAWLVTVRSDTAIYRFFALSNLGSLLGLLTYPILVEPWLGLRAQSALWSAAYLLFMTACLGCGLWLVRRSLPAISPSACPKSPVSVSRRLIWLLLSACPVIVLLATTNRMTQDLAPIPLLWVLPLSLYLISLIISFEHQRWYDRRFWLPLFCLGLVGAGWLQYQGIYTDIRLQLSLYLLVLFLIAMVSHGELYRLRPQTIRLTQFYLYVSLGGALGGIFVSLIAPHIFSDFWEYPLGLVLAGLSLFLVRLIEEHGHSRASSPSDRALTYALGIGVVVLAIALVPLAVGENRLLVKSRNFYGVVSIRESDQGSANWHRDMWYGAVRQGGQMMSPILRQHPTTYFGPNSGAGIALRLHPARGEKAGIRIGAVGLGVGTLASYAMPHDQIRFYEINPQVLGYAKEYFSYLNQCPAELEVVLGDARLSLAKEAASDPGARYDVLLIDAFISDAIPVHLLTREAMELYWQRLETNGILAVHVTALHADFSPVVRDLAHAAGKTVLRVEDPGKERAVSPSVWILITSNSRFLALPELQRFRSLQPKPLTHSLWTDDHTNLLPYLKWVGED